MLVSLGGDIAVGGAAPDGGWRILIAEDSETPSDAAGEVVAIETGAIATSSTTVRRWRRGGRTLHHLIDPRTGGSVDSPWRTASVVAATCVEANTAATAAIVMGDAGAGLARGRRLPARLVARDGAVARLGGWPDPAPNGAGHRRRPPAIRVRTPRRVIGLKGADYHDPLIPPGTSSPSDRTGARSS